MSVEERPMLIGGRRVTAASGRWIEREDPATEEPLGRVPAGGAPEVDTAVAAALAATDDWRYTSANERADLLHHAADLMRAHQEPILELLTREQGKPRVEQEEELEWSMTTFRYYAELARNGSGRILPSGEPRTQDRKSVV